MKNIGQKDANYTIGHVIVVDDEAELMSALCEMLTGQGYEAAGFPTGAEALAVLKEREFDLLLTDLMMPGMDGIELIRAGIEIDPNLIGIIMTGHGTVQTAVEAMKTGAFDYILKPFKLNTLLPLLSRAMHVRNLRLENMQLKETVAIHELGKAVAFSSDLNSILNKIADAALQQCSADEVSIMLPTKGGRELYVAVVRGGHTENLGEHVPVEQGVAGWVARNRELVVFRGEADDPRMAPIRPRIDIHTAVSMPMLSQGKLVGVLNVNITKSHRQFTLGQLKALSILVSIISPILENTWLSIQIRNAEEKYRSIFENAIEGIFQRSPDGKIIAANPSFACIFGYDSPEDLMANVTDFVHQVYVDPDRGAEFTRLMDTEGEVRNFEYQARRKDGSQAWISVNGHAVRDENGVLLYYEGMSEDITDRKRAEETLRESEMELSTIFDGAPVLMLVVDGNYRVRKANRTAQEAVAATEAELRDVPCGEVLRCLHRRDSPDGCCHGPTCETCALRQAVQNTPETGLGVSGIEADFEVEPKGQPQRRSFSLSTSLLQIGGEAMVLVCIEDITERKQAEELMRLQSAALEAAANGIIITDREGMIEWGNPAFTALTGYSFAEVIGKNPRELVKSGEQDQAFYKDLWDTILAGKVWRGQIINRRKDHSLYSEEMTITPLRNERGEISRFIAIKQDITERKRAETLLKESESRLATIFDNDPSGIILVNIKTRTVYDANQAAVEMMGLPKENLVGKVCHNFLCPAEEGHCPICDFGQRVDRSERVLIRADGKHLPILKTVAPIKISGEEYLLENFIDITERKKAEQEVFTLQEQLRQSQKMEDIGRLAGGIAHDFNNLLTVIKGYSQLSLIELKESDPMRGGIEEIKRAADQAADLTRQLLAFSRRQILEMRVLDLNTVLRDLDKMLRRVIGEDIELVTLLAGDLGRVKTDHGQMQQVIMNLAVNARDAMPNGGKLTIETANMELDETYARSHVAVTPGRYVMLSVSDTGVGMTAEVREQVFEPFFTTKEKGKGTGLGLSTVYGIVKQSGGNIWIYSEPGQGTTFKIYLPRVDEPLEELKEKAEVKEIPRGDETILVVEDEDEVRKVAVRILSGQGYKVLEASHGNDAILVCKQHEGPIHLMVTDVVMPNMSGHELAKSLVSLQPGIKVLYMSGYTDNAIVHHGVLEKGMNYIQKPFTLEGLARKVREVLDQ